MQMHKDERILWQITKEISEYFERYIMASEYYREAVKKGQKERRICISEGKNPYLPA